MARAVLRDGGSWTRTEAGAPGRHSDLDRELGDEGRTAAYGAVRRRLAGLGLQHDPAGVRGSLEAAAGAASGAREKSDRVPERALDDVPLRHGRPEEARSLPARG